MAKGPLPKEVIALREEIQARKGMGVTAAQDHCAGTTYTTRRGWQCWERGERKMHPAFWELAKIKLQPL